VETEAGGERDLSNCGKLDTMTAENIAWIVALGGWTIASLQFYLGYRERRQQREEDLLAKTLAYFEGKSQRRSIGISLVEGIWVRRKRYMDIIVPVLVNQAVYLLLSSGSVDAAHEERNLIRLLRLLERCIPSCSDATHHQSEILDAILRKDPALEEKGIPLGRSTLRIWFKRLGGDAEDYNAEHPTTADDV
jgi:hypothetical protein